MEETVKTEKVTKKAALTKRTVTVAEPEKRNVDHFSDMVPVVLPKAPHNEENFQFVSVNGRTYQVPRSGKPVMVPRPVYEVLKNAERMAEYSEDRKAANVYKG